MRVLALISFLLYFIPSYSQSNSSITNLGLSQFEENAFRKEINQATHDKNKFLKLVSFGQALCLAHRYAESNECFERAYQMRTDQQFSTKSRYESYDDIHELFMVLYFKALNYLEMNDFESAMVEGRRIVELMRPMDGDDVDSQLVAADPLAQSLVGLLYSLDHEYDDASLAYRTARNLFEKEYKGLCSKTVPQLVVDKVKEMSNISNLEKKPEAGGHLIFIWHNGEYPMNHLHRDFKVIYDHQRFVSNDISVAIGEDSYGNYWLPFIEHKDPIFYPITLLHNDVPKRCEVLSFASWFSMRVNTMRLEQPGAHMWRHGVNWATLPGQIYWADVKLESGDNCFEFKMANGNELRNVSFSVKGDNKTHVYLLTTLENKTEKTPHNLTPVVYQVGGQPLPRIFDLTNINLKDVYTSGF
jgi:hypothetical protein